MWPGPSHAPADAAHGPEPDISICVCDFVLVRQAILNPIYNACQAMEAQADPRDHDNDPLRDEPACTDHRDTGPGIPR
jgi:signal transduction histidine kinase